MRFDSKHSCALPVICWGFSFAVGHGLSFFSGIQHSPVNVCSATSGNFGTFPGEDEHTSFYSAIFANIHWITEKAREFQKNIYFCFTDYTKAFDCVDHNKLWKILKEIGIPDYLTCLLRNLCVGQEATVRTRHGTMDWFKIGEGVHQGYIWSPCLVKFYTEYIM